MRERHVNFRKTLAVQAAVANVLIHTDDLPGDRRAKFGDAGN